MLCDSEVFVRTDLLLVTVMLVQWKKTAFEMMRTNDSYHLLLINTESQLSLAWSTGESVIGDRGEDAGTLLTHHIVDERFAILLEDDASLPETDQQNQRT